MKLDTSLSEQELEEYLGSQRTLGLATPDRDGAPHVIPLWFVWLDGSVFMNTTLGNATVRNLERDPRATATVDDREGYAELRGVVLQGRAVRADGDPGSTWSSAGGRTSTAGATPYRSASGGTACSCGSTPRG